MASPPDNSLSTLNLDESLIDESRMHRYRLTRIQAELAKRDLAALITYDPVNTRYATGMRNMQVWAFHSVIRMAFIPAEGDVVLFEYAGSEHLSDGLDTVREVRASIPLHFGPGLSNTQSETRLNRWRAEVEDVARETCGNHKRIALDNQVPYIAGQALNAAGFEIAQGYDVLASAQAVKNEDELRAMRRSLEVAELGINKLEQNITPQSTENKLWSLLNQVNVEHGGEYMDTRLLSSGPRTNPWYQECSSRVIQSGDMIALDTDMIGPYGYDADISRSFVCGPDAPTARQREIYRLAYEHIQHNMALLEPGKSFRQLSEQAFRLPERYQAQAISMNWHGVSLYGGWPTILGYGFFDETSEDGEVVPGMTLCVESSSLTPSGPPTSPT